MAEYIEREALLRAVSGWRILVKDLYDCGYDDCITAIEDTVSDAPAVEVVCCKDCKYWKQERYASSEVYMNCTRHDRGYGDAQPREAMDFCSYGKRKDNGNAAT